jgi:hypothetical protein
MKLHLSAGLTAGLIAISAAPAAAAPVTVTLRIEGPTRTLFEGPVTTDARPFHFSGDADHPCGAPAVTRGAVFAAAEDAAPFSAKGQWFDSFGSPSFSEIAGEGVAFDPATNRFLVEYLNGQQSQVGSCQETVATGDSVLYAYGTGTEPLLSLSGPANVAPGAGATLRVTAGADPVAGASVGGAQSGADGSVSVGPLADRGDHVFKASKDGSIRSNALHVCVTDGNDGACGSAQRNPPLTPAPDRTPPTAKLAGLTDHAILKTGPRELRGSFTDAGGVKQVKLRLTKRLGKRCWYFSGSMERFRRVRCGRGAYFGIGDKADWSYLLPARLGKGRYVLDAVAIDAAGNRTPLERGTTRVVFTVR